MLFDLAAFIELRVFVRCMNKYIKPTVAVLQDKVHHHSENSGLKYYFRFSVCVMPNTQ